MEMMVTMLCYLTDNRSQQHEVSKEDCPKYKIGQCPHGISGKTKVGGEDCKFTHRKRCRKFCKFGSTNKLGCQRGDDCKYFHPTLCKYSVQRGVCTNLECKFTHLKHTQRFDRNKNYNDYHDNHQARTHSTRGRNSQINNVYGSQYDTRNNTNYRKYNYNGYHYRKQNMFHQPTHSARVDVHPGFGDPSQATSANTGRNTDRIPDINHNIFSFLAQQVQQLKKGLEGQIGDLKSCLLANTTDANPLEQSRNQENLVHTQNHSPIQNFQLQYPEHNILNPYQSIHAQQQEPQHQHPHLQNQWNPNQPL